MQCERTCLAARNYWHHPVPLCGPPAADGAEWLQQHPVQASQPFAGQRCLGLAAQPAACPPVLQARILCVPTERLPLFCRLAAP